MIKRLFAVDAWRIHTTELNKAEKRLQESLTAIGNGYMGLRGNFEEGYSGDTHQGTYLAGVWFPDKTRVGWWKNGYPEYFGKVINATNFIGLDITVDGQKLDLYTATIRDFSLELDMKAGVLRRSFTLVQDGKEVQFAFERFLSIVQQQLALIRVHVTAGAQPVQLSFSPYLDGAVRNEDSNYDEQFWLPVARSAAEGYVTVETAPNPFGTPRFTVTTAMTNRYSFEAAVAHSETELMVRETTTTTLAAGQSLDVVKYVAVVTSRDVAPDEQAAKAQALLADAQKQGYALLQAAHQEAWAERWRKADVVIEGDDEAQQGIRFNIFQLFSTYYGEDARLNVGPKGFTGEKYGGATYWDTEAYIVPMYLSVADQQVTKELLLYRYNQLDGAYHNARQQGLDGALYPMVTFTGVECHNEWEITFEEIHRNGAIAHAIYNYTQYTGDTSYQLAEGLDVLVGISRFWADRVHFSQRAGKYMMHGVTGPNEYENNVNNNYHTNNIARWTLQYTLDVLAQASDERRQQLGVTLAECERWAQIVDQMYLPYDEELGIYVQHDTFLDKDLRPVSELSANDRPLNQKWSWDKILRSPYIKQADVLQSIYFFNDQYTLAEKERNFLFYEPLTVHESSLSPCIHAILAAELGMEDKAVELYARTARLDLDNYNNDTEDGLHITSMSGSWLSIVQGFAGMRVVDGHLSFKPFVPKGWTAYRFKVNFRGRLLEVRVEQKSVTVQLLSGEALDVMLAGKTVTVHDSVQQAL